MNERLGLLTEKSVAIPLKGVKVEGDILGRGAKVRVLQRFKNAEEQAVEAVYKFPLPEGAAICGFTARIDGKIVRGEVEEREEAFKKYDKALAEGHGGYLLDEERPNIFTLSVGNLNPGSEAIIEIEYVTLLDKEGSRVRFFLPMTISPRYIPADMPDEGGIPPGAIVNPSYAADVPYGLSISLNIHNGAALQSIESPTHPIRVEIGSQPAHVEFSSESVKMDRDLILYVDFKDSLTTSRAYRYSLEGETFIQVDLSIDENQERAKHSAGMKENSVLKEVIFVVDCSGSMSGDSIYQAKKALEICLRALASDTGFNIYRFGSTFEKLFKEPMPYTEENLQKASDYLKRMDADLGGTEIFAPLQHICSTKLGEGVGGRDIILLTDGEVGNEDQILGLLRKNRASTRMFALGIGAGPNEYFIKGLARKGKGAYEFIYPGERIEPKVLRIFQKVSQKGLEELAIEWGRGDVEQAPVAPVIFTDSPTTIFARHMGSDCPEAVTVRAMIGGQRREWEIKVVGANSEQVPIPALWARERIRDLESSDDTLAIRGSRQMDRKSKQLAATIIDLSKKYGILSMLTSYIAVEEREEKDKTTGEVVLRKVPVLVTVGWHGIGSVGVVGEFAYDMICDRSIAPPPRQWARERIMNRMIRREFQQAAPVRKETLKVTYLSILSLQRAEGGFELSDEIADVLHVSLRDIRKKANNITVGIKVDKFRLFSTAIALEILEQSFAADHATWAPLVQKSRHWLEEIVKKGYPRIEAKDLMDWAREFVLGALQKSAREELT